MLTSSRIVRRALIVIFFLSLAIRVSFIWLQASYHLFDIYFVASDSRLYEMIAHGLLAGSGYSMMGRPTAVVAPGYPLFLAALHSIGIESALAVGFAQAVIGAVTCVLIAVLARKVSGERAAISAGVLAAFYVHLVFWTGYVLTETLFVFLVVASLVALVKWQERVSLQGRAVLAGILMGLGALTRPHLVGFALLAAIYIAAQSAFPRAAFKAAVVMLIALVVVLSPWIIRNYRVFGVPIAGSTLSGEVLYQGNSDGATGGSGGYLDARDFRRLELPSDLSELDVNRAYSRAALSFMRNHPDRLPRLALIKFVNMWRPTYAGSSVRNVIIFGGSYLFVVAWSAVGVARLGKDAFRGTGGLLLLCLGFLITLHLVVPGMIRYRLPAEPVLIVFASVGLEVAFDWLSNIGWAREPATFAI